MTAPFKTTVKLNDKFNEFPEALRTKLEAAHEADIAAHMQQIESRPVIKASNRYAVISAQGTRPSAANFTSTTTIHDNIGTSSSANIALLEHFLANHTSKIKKSPERRDYRGQQVVPASTNFVYLETVDGVANPDFVLLHAVKYGEIGCGVDACGCLSFCTVEIVDGRCRFDALFVERVGIKIEE
ncbi:hypothetical protein CC80DRAFT_598771 [Byssothecium circinans]|uniref:Uncharacterized protein n=1 Tax=Byssothecium circinans TaxID=147558 RepID=A0A6A5T9F3_9PLEO|nr:hypothetical protein CC80DRAFT_598771 [Byssothecium circinans]